MLIRFAVGNYTSFKDRQVFSMAAGKQTRHASHCFTMNGRRLLKSSFFFGANASGKSNFVRALDFMRRMVLMGCDSIQYHDRYFRVDPDSKEKPGVFQIDFIADNKVYSYGFAFDYLTHYIEGEWLYRLEPSGKEVRVFEREFAESNSEKGSGQIVNSDLSWSKTSKTRFEIYHKDLTKPQLLLREVGNKNIKDDADFQDFLEAYNWFKKLIVIYPNSHARSKNEIFFSRESSADSMIGMLRAFDTGIENISKEKQPAEKAFSFLPDEVKKPFLDKIEQTMRTNLQDGSIGKVEIGDPQNHQFEITIDNGEFVAEKIMLDHGNPKELFELSDESDGTKRLFDLIPLYKLGQKDRIIIVDELDRSFHSKLTEEFIRRFFEYTQDKPSQLICTTHDINLLDLKFLRQDEIWFVEREKDHSSRIYSLADYKERFDKNVINDYLIGRYGAIPCFQENEWQVDSE